MFDLQPPRHISTLRSPVVAAHPGKGPFTIPLRTLLIVRCQPVVFESTTYVPVGRRWREPDPNHRSRSYDQYPNGLKKAPELCAHGQPRCVRTREMRGRSRYPDNRMVRRGPIHARTLYRNHARRE